MPVFGIIRSITLIKMGRFPLIFAFSLTVLHHANCQGQVAQQNSTSANITANATNVPSNSQLTTVPIRTAVAPSPSPKKEPLKLVCYYNKIAENRTKLNLADVDSSLCTHVIYSFAEIDLDTFSVRSESLTANYGNVVALKEKGIVVMLGLGGSSLADPTESEKFSKIVNDGGYRSTFIRNVVSFLRQHKLQGLDINWEYPSCWNGYCKSGRAGDKGNFINLLRELHAALKFYKMLLSVAVSPLDTVADQAYEVREIAHNVDFINLMTFDYNKSYAATALNAPFQGPSSVSSTVEYWKSKGAPGNQLILVIPTFGRTYTLANENWNKVNSASVIGKPTLLGEPGIAAFYEVCKGLSYQMVEHQGPYAFKGDQWVSFDDIPMVAQKGEYIKKIGLGGAAIWSLDTDDFNGQCDQGKYPLIKTIRTSMGFGN